jgi:hypothetical protein
MRRRALLSLLVMAAACDEPGAPVHFELDVVVDVGASQGVLLYLHELDGSCCMPEHAWPVAGACTEFTDGFQCHCGDLNRFRCLASLRVEQAGAVVGQADLRQAIADVGISGPIAPGVAGDLIFEGCGADVRVPFVPRSLAAPQVTATREAESADVSWSLPAGATATAYWYAPEGSFVSNMCQTVDEQATVPAAADRPLTLMVMAVAPPESIRTSLGVVRVWTASSAHGFSLPPP